VISNFWLILYIVARDISPHCCEILDSLRTLPSYGVRGSERARKTEGERERERERLVCACVWDLCVMGYTRSIVYTVADIMRVIIIQCYQRASLFAPVKVQDAVAYNHRREKSEWISRIVSTTFYERNYHIVAWDNHMYLEPVDLSVIVNTAVNSRSINPR